MSTFAVVETGNKQYLVKQDDVILVEKPQAIKDGEVSLDHVLMIKSSDKASFGTPYVNGAKVLCQVLEAEERQPKVISFKYRRRKNSRRKKGHRQTLTRLQVKAIQG